MASETGTADGFEPIVDAGFIDLVGPLHFRPRDGAYAFRAEAKHANLIGVVHGGMLMSFADRALGETAMRAAGGANCVTIQLKMKFIDVGRIGDWLDVLPQVVKRTGSLVFMRADVRDGARLVASAHVGSLVFMRADVRDGARLVASADGVWKILRRRPEGA